MAARAHCHRPPRLRLDPPASGGPAGGCFRPRLGRKNMGALVCYGMYSWSLAWRLAHTLIAHRGSGSTLRPPGALPGALSGPETTGAFAGKSRLPRCVRAHTVSESSASTDTAANPSSTARALVLRRDRCLQRWASVSVCSPSLLHHDPSLVVLALCSEPLWRLDLIRSRRFYERERERGGDDVTERLARKVQGAHS